MVSKQDDDEPNYTITGVVSTGEIPNWARRKPKWKELVQAVLDLEPGTSLTVVFENKKTAVRACNAVRDDANRRLKAAAVRTRVVTEADGKAMAYLARLFPEDIVHEVRKMPPGLEVDQGS